MDPTQIPGPPPPPKGSTVEQQKDIGLRAVKLPPSADAIVVRTTLGFLAEIRRGLPGRNEAGSFWGEIGTKFSFGTWLLLKFPSFFSVGWFRKKGPSEDEKALRFKMWFVGRGYSDSSLVSLGNRKPDMEIITRKYKSLVGSTLQGIRQNKSEAVFAFSLCFDVPCNSSYNAVRLWLNLHLICLN
ncbi:hypothetical protein TB2_023293 [Malus domestica]